MPLTDIKCKNIKPKEKPYKLADGGGLYLEVMANGSKCWRQKYRFLGKEKRLALGIYPLVSLLEARESRDAAKKLLAAGTDPSTAKKDQKRQAIQNASNTFEAVALEWHGKQAGRWATNTGEKVMGYIKNNIFPYIGTRPIADITPLELLDALRKIEARGAHYSAGRIRQICGQVFRYGVATGKAPRDPSADLRGALTTNKTKHYAALSIKDMPLFLQTLEKNDARLFAPTRRAIRLLMLTFVRTTELIHATWKEFDLENGQWNIPAERMKMRIPHIVPLSKQAITVLKEQKEDIKHLNTDFVFPNQVRPMKSMSNNTVLSGIKRMGYAGRMTGHGFRALAMTTLMEELSYAHEIPDAQLAHAKGDSTRRAYDRTKYLPQRKKMMQQWSDYLDAIASGSKVVAGNFKKRA
jgi:integrase